MKSVLDKINFKKSDKEMMINHIENFTSLCYEAYHKSQNIDLPQNLLGIKKFVIVGMGASGICGDIIKNILFDKDFFIETIHSYTIPDWVDRDTCVIAISYSGDTEETLSAFNQAKNQNAKLIAISNGGKLKEKAKDFGATFLEVDYLCQPRSSFPYIFYFLLNIFIKLNYYQFNHADFSKSQTYIEERSQKFSYKNNFANNPAKKLAAKIKNKLPVIYGGDHLENIAKRFKTQINENAKCFAFYNILPELNHNEVTAYKLSKNKIFIIILKSSLNNPLIVKRIDTTVDILKKNKLEYFVAEFKSPVNTIADILSNVLLADWVSYYLAILNKVDPSQIDNIEYLKTKLKN